MKLLDRTKNVLHPTPRENRPPSETRTSAEKREASLRFHQRRAEQLNAERTRLTPEDQILASGYRLPRIYVDRARAARELLTVGDRKRTQREVAAIMGLRPYTVMRLLADPDGSETRARAVAKQKAYKPRTRRTPPQGVAVLAPPAEELATRIRRRRRSMKFSQVKLAEKLGVDVEQVRTWESGEHRPGPAQYAQLSQLLSL